MPKLINAGARVAPGQPLRERQLRRLIRRLDEIRHLEIEQYPLPPDLVRACVRGCSTWDLQQQAELHQWGACRDILHRKLQETLRQSHQTAIATWIAKVKNFDEACKWLKRKAPPPWSLRHGEEQSTGRSDGAELLRRAWKPIFGTGHDPQSSIRAFLSEYHAWIPNFPQIQCPELSADDLRKSVRQMRHKAAGTDQWCASALLALPDTAWAQLVQILRQVETWGTWPDALTQWRLTFVPKGQNAAQVTEATKVRPIAIGSLIFRAYAKRRFHQLGTHLTQCLPPLQVGGLPHLGLDTLVLAMQNETSFQSHPYAASLDFQKAFDSADWSLVVQLLPRAGVPDAIVSALAGMWKSQTRWVTLGTCVAKRPLRNLAALLQGDPWAPLGLSLVLAPVIRRIASRIPAGFQITYMDDRTGLLDTPASLRLFLEEWRAFERLGRLKSNQTKTQIWGRTPQAVSDLREAGFTEAKDSFHVLGITFGATEPTPEDIKRQSDATSRATAIAYLPVSAKLKRGLAQAVYASHAAWGTFLKGRGPTAQEQSKFATEFNQATKCPSFPGGRASTQLRRAFFLGHSSDLGLFSLHRFVRSSFAWFDYRAQGGISVSWSDQAVQMLQKALRPLGWTASSQGIKRSCGAPLGCDFGVHRGFLDAVLHHVRVAWRHGLVTHWLKSKTRRDSAIAREVGLLVSDSQIDTIHTFVQNQCDAHMVAILTGGMMTAAIDFQRFQDGLGPTPDCPYCGVLEVPSVEHVLWSCEAFNSLRNLPPPGCLLTRRLGWGPSNNPNLKLLQQMAAIRRSEAQLRLKASPRTQRAA